MKRLLKIILHDSNGVENLFWEGLYVETTVGLPLDLNFSTSIPVSLLAGYTPTRLFLNGETIELHLTQY